MVMESRWNELLIDREDVTTDVTKSIGINMELPKSTDPTLQFALLRAIALRDDRTAVAEELRPEVEKALNQIVSEDQKTKWTDRISFALIDMRDKKKWLESPFYESGGKGNASMSRHWIKSNRPGSDPTQRIWKISELGMSQVSTGTHTPDHADIVAAEQSVSIFESTDADEAREKVYRLISLRRGQPKFRKDLLGIYRRCVISGCNAESALEAAHIRPYSTEGTNALSNGLLLRADLHSLFDLDLIAIDPEKLTVWLAEELLSTTYRELLGKRLLLPPEIDGNLDRDALKERWSNRFSGGSPRKLVS